MKKLALITFVTLATVWFTQTLSAQGLIITQPPAGWPSNQPWPPMPTVNETVPPPVLPPQPGPSFIRPPEWVLPNYGMIPLDASPVPEPATCSLLALGGLAGWLLRRRSLR